MPRPASHSRGTGGPAARRRWQPRNTARGSDRGQRACLGRLAEAGKQGLPATALAAAGADSTVVARLRQRGLVTVDLRRLDRDPFAPGAGALPLEMAEPPGPAAVRRLTAGQHAALDALAPLAALNKFDVALLRGVTGSGKTEVYLRLAREVAAAGRRVLLLVPEIALTPAVAAAFRNTFGARVAIQHSGLSDGERHDQWQPDPERRGGRRRRYTLRRLRAA